MPKNLKEWFAKNSNAPGVLAFAAYLPDKTSLTHSCGPKIPQENLDTVWRAVLEAIPVLQLNHLPSARVRWVFSEGVVHCERRADGVCLGIFASQDSNAMVSPEVERLLTEFSSL